jgi:hypothetical protein
MENPCSTILSFDAGVVTPAYIAKAFVLRTNLISDLRSAGWVLIPPLSRRGWDKDGAPALVLVRAKFKRGSFGSVGREKRVQLRSG